MMTQNDILTIVYNIVKASPIDGLNGGVYKSIRPTNSGLEDCVISLINGNNAKFVQDGGLFVKIYYLDLNQKDSYLEDTERGGELEKLLQDLSTELLKNNSGISFEVQSRQTYTARIEELKQHYAILRINFKIT
jgi:hypothetical protein